jgi:hypothetical protein
MAVRSTVRIEPSTDEQNWFDPEPFELLWATG